MTLSNRAPRFLLSLLSIKVLMLRMFRNWLTTVSLTDTGLWSIISFQGIRWIKLGAISTLRIWVMRLLSRSLRSSSKSLGKLNRSDCRLINKDRISGMGIYCIILRKKRRSVLRRRMESCWRKRLSLSLFSRKSKFARAKSTKLKLTANLSLLRDSQQSTTLMTPKPNSRRWSGTSSNNVAP